MIITDLKHWIYVSLAAALALAGCAAETTSGETTGSLNLNLELADGITINEVVWRISGNDMDMTGTIDTSAPGATASVEVFGLPPGDGYLVELSATDESGEVTCKGDAEFAVEVGVATDVMVFLNCKLPRELGAVRVNGKFNICAQLAKAVVSPLQTSVGNEIDLSAQAKTSRAIRFRTNGAPPAEALRTRARRTRPTPAKRWATRSSRSPCPMTMASTAWTTGPSR